ncbi:MAG TPA: hypothetical protein VFP84_34525 [Kofleriaceae bacterium]|nr:hypothetical protein [Kofleriaceae bacterium]
MIESAQQSSSGSGSGSQNAAFDNAAQAPGPGKQSLTATRMDVAKAHLGIGNHEPGHHRAGGMHARQANVELISADAPARAQKIEQVLRTGVGNRHSFELITPWLMGSDPKALATAYQTLAGRALGDDITKAFGGQAGMRGYLLDVLEHGEPRLASRLAMASGMVTSTRSDWPEVLRLLREADASDVGAALRDATLKRHLETSSRVKAVIDVAGKKDAHDKATEAVTTAEADGDEAAVTTAKGHEATAKQAHADAKLAELVAIVNHRQQLGRGLDRDKLAADLSAWAKKADQEIRDQAVKPGSPFLAALDRQAAAVSPLARLSQPDRAYLIAVAGGKEPVKDEVMKPEQPANADAEADAEPKTPEELAKEAEDKQEKRDKEAKEAGLKIGELDAYIDRKAASNHALKHQHWSTLKTKIEGLDDDQRATYLRTQMSADDRAIFDGDESTAAQKAEVRARAIATIRTRLRTTGMSEPVAARVLAPFQAAAAPDSSKYHSSYQKLRRLALGGPTLQFSKQAFRLVGQLTNQEYMQVRDDGEVMAALEKRCDAPTFAKITAVLGHDPAAAANGEGLSGKAARERGSNEAELKPTHWTALLQRELGKGTFARHEDKVLSVATRAYYAAQRRAALPPEDDGRKPELPRGLPPIAVAQFTAEVLAGLTSAERAQLEREDPAGFAALTTGRAVTASERIDAATFSVVSPKRLKGTNARPSDITRAVDDAQGRELLEQWSNVADWRALQAERTAKANDPAAVAQIDARMRAFVVDVNPEVHDQLRSLLPRDKLLGVLTKLREKLGKAMKDDPTFKLSMIVSGMPTDGHAQERTKGLAALDQQRMENSGAQWNSLVGIGVSAKSAEGKESSNLLAGRLRSAHNEIEGADDKEAARAKVNDDQVEDITKMREEHADRMKSAAALKKRANEIATTVVTVLSGIVITGATFGTGGLAFAPQVGIALAKAFAAGVLKGALKKALEGDKFNAVDTISSITMDLMVTSIMSAGIAAPTGPNALAEASAGFKGKKDAASLFQNAAMKWAINTGVREAITTATTRAMDADPKKLGLDQEAMVRLRAWVEDFALTMATTDANRHTAGYSQAEKDTTKLIPGAVKPVTAELTRPVDDKVKAERRVLGKPTVAESDLGTASGVTRSQLAQGKQALKPSPGPRPVAESESAHGVTASALVAQHQQLNVTDGPRPVAESVSAHGVTASALVAQHQQLNVTDGPRPAAEPVSAHGVTASALQHGHQQLQPGTHEQIVRARAVANDLARNLATYGAQVPAGLRAQCQMALNACRLQIDQVQTALAMGHPPAVAQLRAVYDRADDANTDLMVTVLSAIRVPTHTPVPAMPSVPQTEPGQGAPQRERQAEAQLS